VGPASLVTERGGGHVDLGRKKNVHKSPAEVTLAGRGKVNRFYRRPKRGKKEKTGANVHRIRSLPRSHVSMEPGTGLGA